MRVTVTSLKAHRTSYPKDLGFIQQAAEELEETMHQRKIVIFDGKAPSLEHELHHKARMYRVTSKVVKFFGTFAFVFNSMISTNLIETSFVCSLHVALTAIVAFSSLFFMMQKQEHYKPSRIKSLLGDTVDALITHLESEIEKNLEESTPYCSIKQESIGLFPIETYCQGEHAAATHHFFAEQLHHFWQLNEGREAKERFNGCALCRQPVRQLTIDQTKQAANIALLKHALSSPDLLERSAKSIKVKREYMELLAETTGKALDRCLEKDSERFQKVLLNYCAGSSSSQSRLKRQESSHIKA